MKQSEKFANRFKGKTSVINKDGHIGVVTKAGKPVQKVSSLRAGGLSISNANPKTGQIIRSSTDLLSQQGTPSRRAYPQFGDASPGLTKVYSGVGPQSAYFNINQFQGSQQGSQYYPQEQGSSYPKSVPYMPMHSLMHPSTAEQTHLHAHDTTSMFNANPLPNLTQLSATLDPQLFSSALPNAYQGQQGDHIRSSMDERYNYPQVYSAQQGQSYIGGGGGVKNVRRIGAPPMNRNPPFMQGKLKTDRRHTDAISMQGQMDDNYYRQGAGGPPGYNHSFDTPHQHMSGDTSFSSYMNRSTHQQEPPYPSDNMYPLSAQQFIQPNHGFDSPMRRAGAEQIMNSPAKHAYQMADARSSSVQPYPYQQSKYIEPDHSQHETYSYQRTSQPPQKKYYELGGLGPNVGSQDWMKAKQRSEMAQQYSRNIKVYNKQAIRTNSRGNPVVAGKHREPTARERALEFAKNIKKPLPGSRGMNSSQQSFKSGAHESEVLMGKMEELEARHSELESEVARIRAELQN